MGDNRIVFSRGSKRKQLVQSEIITAWVSISPKTVMPVVSPYTGWRHVTPAPRSLTRGGIKIPEYWGAVTAQGLSRGVFFS